jgi:hypothetical protein
MQGAAKSHCKGQGNRRDRTGDMSEITSNQSSSKTACILTTNLKKVLFVVSSGKKYSAPPTDMNHQCLQLKGSLSAS